MSVHENGGQDRPMQHGKPETLRPTKGERQETLFKMATVELDEQDLRMVLDGLYRIRQKHSGGYAARAIALYERLAREQERLEKGDA